MPIENGGSVHIKAKQIKNKNSVNETRNNTSEKKPIGYIEYSFGGFVCASDSNFSGLMQATRFLVKEQLSLFMLYVTVLCIYFKHIIPLIF